MEEMKTVKLNKLFNSAQLKELRVLIKTNNLKELKEYLNKKEIKEQLLKKGLLSDYLFYYLQHAFNLDGENK